MKVLQVVVLAAEPQVTLPAKQIVEIDSRIFVVPICSNIQELAEMLKELVEAASKFGSVMNTSKIKILSFSEEDFYLHNNKLENIAEYIYLGHTIRLGKENQVTEVNRRIKLTWVAFGKMNDIFKNKDIIINLKKKVYDICVLPVSTNDLEKMTLIKMSSNKLPTIYEKLTCTSKWLGVEHL